MSIQDVNSMFDENAKLYDKSYCLIGTCIDNRNSIAKAVMECPEIEFVSTPGAGTETIARYVRFMTKENKAQSCLRKIDPHQRYLDALLTQMFGSDYKKLFSLRSRTNMFCRQAVTLDVKSRSEAEMLCCKLLRIKDLL